MSEKLDSTKRIYFVRHGETDANVAKLVQSPDQPLNERGLLQAARIADRSRNLSFQKIIASDYSRASQTAAAIGDANAIEVEVSSLFREYLGPSQFFGSTNSTPEFLEYLALQREHRDDPIWHFSDEENYHDIAARADRAWEQLTDDPCTDILVVTHGLFLRMLVSKVLLGDLLTPDIWYATGGSMKMSNTGITVCVHEGGMWKLLTWNDHAHFAE
jgi:broad specificity phosphatase PhoE